MFFIFFLIKQPSSKSESVLQICYPSWQARTFIKSCYLLPSFNNYKQLQKEYFRASKVYFPSWQGYTQGTLCLKSAGSDEKLKPRNSLSSILLFHPTKSTSVSLGMSQHKNSLGMSRYENLFLKTRKLLQPSLPCKYRLMIFS